LTETRLSAIIINSFSPSGDAPSPRERATAAGKQGTVIMEAYAVVETGGKQYRVEVGKTFDIERLSVQAGNEVEISEVLAVSDGNELRLGKPYVEGAKVVFTVVADDKRGEKVVNFKKRKRKGYERKVGHRQALTTVTVTSIA
jgi:large subunit ribosomal protein L21